MLFEDINWNEIDNNFMNALEAKDTIISEATRKGLPDSDFALVYHDDKSGVLLRRYPVYVKGDADASGKLVRKAIQFFHFCVPNNKKKLAAGILKAIKRIDEDFGDIVKISDDSMITKYIDIPSKYRE